MQTSKLSVGTHRLCGAQTPVGVVRVAPCRRAMVRAPVRMLAVHPSGISSTPAVEKATTHKAPTSPVKETWAKVQGMVKNSAKMAVVLGVALALVLGTPDAAHAARSAGRAGGFHSAAPSRSYGGGGGMGMGSRGGYSGGYSPSFSGGFGSYSAPRTYSAPIIVPGPPIYSPRVMVAPGAAVVSAGPSIVDVAIVSMFLVVAASAATGMLKGSGEAWETAGGGGKPTLTRVQVGLLSLARELKHDLDRMAARADTSSSRGLHNLLQEVVLALLRNPSYCVYGAASQRTCDSTSSLETAFNKASMKERSKFEQETLVNVSGAAPSRSNFKRAGNISSKPDELVVVTLLVATDGAVDAPAKIDSLASLQKVLQALGGLQQEQVLGVELMWTPQAEGDYFTRDELITDYPSLRQL
eukprot:GHRQ01001395.1.p1 GENE.GHRQ01001395.1~~GHRQ01001395.1.p1  ORF type:complete len:412 (+),score=136.93 GHRQ01001395.1:119-1354(+)